MNGNPSIQMQIAKSRIADDIARADRYRSMRRNDGVDTETRPTRRWWRPRRVPRPSVAAN